MPIDFAKPEEPAAGPLQLLAVPRRDIALE